MSTVRQYIEELAELDAQAKIPNASLDTILECIQKPITWLCESLDTQQQQLEFLFHKAWKQHVWHVFYDMLPKWSFSFSSTHKDGLFNTLILPSCPDQVRVHMARTSLPVLIECLSNSDDLDFGTLEIYAQSLELLCFSSHVVPYYALYIPKMDVRFFCSLICSIPTHLANAFGIQLQETRFNVQHEWYLERNFYARMSQRLAENLSKESIYYTQELLGKMIRQGHEDIVMKSIYPSARKSPLLWPQVFEQLAIIASPDQVVQSMLYYVRQHQEKSVTSIAKDIASILLKGNEDVLNTFLNIGLLKLSKSSWADDVLTRIIVSAVVMTEPMPNNQVAPNVYSILLKFSKKVIQYWSDPVFIQYASTRERLYLTMSILSLLAYIEDGDIKSEIMIETSLIKSVSCYFDTGDASIAQLGAVVAESVSSRVDKEKALDTGLLSNHDKMVELKQLIFNRDAFNDEKEEEMDLVLSESESEEEQEELLDPDAEFVIEASEESDLEAYYMEEESEDEGMKKESSTKKQHKKPVFIRDLIGCLKDQNDPFKLELGLKEAEKVIRGKIGAGTELSEMGILLAKYIIGFPTSFEIEDASELQQNALTALIVGVPETVTGFIIDQLYDRNTSIGQKQLILGSISLAVKELAGWLSDTPKEEEGQVQAIDIIGQSLFKSRRMEIAKRKRTQKNKLSGLAGDVFFFPLLVGWWEGAQGRIKYWIGNNTLLTERFIMTLNIILYSSTNTLDKRRIVREYFEFCLSMRYFKNTSIGIQKALLLGIDTILNISYKHQEQLLLNDYFKELTHIKEWIEDTMEKQTEASVQELMIRILLRLSQMANSL